MGDRPHQLAWVHNYCVLIWQTKLTWTTCAFVFSPECGGGRDRNTIIELHEGEGQRSLKNASRRQNGDFRVTEHARAPPRVYQHDQNTLTSVSYFSSVPVNIYTDGDTVTIKY